VSISINLQLSGNRSVRVLDAHSTVLYSLIHGRPDLSKTEQLEIAEIIQAYDFLIRQKTKKERVELVEEIHKAIMEAPC